MPKAAATLRNYGHEVFDDWYAAGPEADDYWQRYEQDRGNNLQGALRGHAANHVFGYDKTHLDRASAGILLLPAGRSGHLESGYLIGQGKPVWIVTNGEPERFDVMYLFATNVFTSLEQLIQSRELDYELRSYHGTRIPYVPSQTATYIFGQSFTVEEGPAPDTTTTAAN